MNYLMISIDLQDIHPIKWWSPTLYTICKTCCLAGVLKYNNIPPLLPENPNRFVGRVFHKVLELTAKRTLHTIDDFEKIWDQEISAIEETMKKSNLNARFIPLDSHSKEYYIKKELCKLSVEKILQSKLQGSYGGTYNYSSAPEKQIQVEKYAVRGRPDLIIQGGRYSKIIDYKTGSPIENGPSGHQVRGSIIIQLEIYAAMYYLENGIWPEASIIIEDGSEFKIECEINHSLGLIKKAYNSIMSINSIIESSKSVEEFFHMLACPAPQSCKFCQYRPLCSQYWKTRVSSNDFREIHDMIGLVRSVSPWEGKRLKIDLCSLDETQQKSTIIRVPNSPQYLQFEKGDIIAAYSLNMNEKNQDYYHYGNYSVIYTKSSNQPDLFFPKGSINQA